MKKNCSQGLRYVPLDENDVTFWKDFLKANIAFLLKKSIPHHYDYNDSQNNFLNSE